MRRSREIVLPLVVGAALGLAAFLLLTTSPASLVGARYAGWCFAVSALAHGVEAALAAFLPRPRIAAGAIDGRAAEGVRASWLTMAGPLGVDALLVALGWGLFALDLTHGSIWMPFSLLLALAVCWYAGRLVLYAWGRCRRPGLWIAGTDLVHEARWGTEVVPLRALVDVRSAAERVMITTGTPPRRRLCPRPWRRAALPARELHVSVSGTGHTADEVADWVRSATGLPGRPWETSLRRPR